MFPHSVTIYNKYKVAGVEKWQRTFIDRVQWNAIKGSVVRKTGVSSADSLQLIIPYPACTARKYIDPKAWTALEDKSDYWTLQSGDTVIKGSVDYEVVQSSSELKSYDDCLTITSVDAYDYGIPHWEVAGK